MDILPDDCLIKIIQQDAIKLLLTSKKWYILFKEILNENINNHSICSTFWDSERDKNIKLTPETKINIPGAIQLQYQNILLYKGYFRISSIHIEKIDFASKISIILNFSPSERIILQDIMNELKRENSEYHIQIRKGALGIEYTTSIYDIRDKLIVRGIDGMFDKISFEVFKFINWPKLVEYVCDFKNWNLADFLDSRVITELQKVKQI